MSKSKKDKKDKKKKKKEVYYGFMVMGEYGTYFQYWIAKSELNETEKYSLKQIKKS